MEIFIVLVFILLILGVLDLTVGVANDAVNFTNSAIGSRAASRKVILAIAAVGVIIGALTSGGMMEVARKGIFNPQFFTLSELMMIFITVMITDIILLDVYNTFGLPTSTTVSLVSELMGAALFLGLYKMSANDSLFDVINAASALKIITSIMLSIIIAFTTGMVAMFLFRTIFSFDLKKNMKRFGGLFSGMIASTIVFFIMIGALKNSDLVPADFKSYVLDHFFESLMVGFVFFSIIFQFLALKGINIFRINILMGTGALAMAFASNDLVNFIGVPLAGFNTFQLIEQNGGDASIMGASLAKSVYTPSYLLLIAGIIMIITLFLSRKAEQVTKTEVSLASSAEGNIETFEPNHLARIFVQMTLGFWASIRSIIPSFIVKWFNERFDQNKVVTPEKELTKKVDFDELRANVNIMTASALILIATMIKLPLSTTFVSFMVAMGTSLTDRAWGRENAVHRVSGVLTVVGGWFFTAILASLTAGLVITIIHFTQFWGLLVLLPLAVALYIVSGRVYRRRKKNFEDRYQELLAAQKNPDKAVSRILAAHSEALNETKRAVDRISNGVSKGERKDIKKSLKSIENINHIVFTSFGRILDVTKRIFNSAEAMQVHGFSESVNNLKRIKSALSRLRTASLSRVDTYHTGLSKDEAGHVQALVESSEKMISLIQKGISNMQIKYDRTLKTSRNLSKLRLSIHHDQVTRNRKGGKGLQNTLSYLVIIDELTHVNEELVDLSVNLSSVLTGIAKEQQKASQKKKAAEKKKSTGKRAPVRKNKKSE